MVYWDYKYTYRVPHDHPSRNRKDALDAQPRNHGSVGMAMVPVAALVFKSPNVISLYGPVSVIHVVFLDHRLNMRGRSRITTGWGGASTIGSTPIK